MFWTRLPLEPLAKGERDYWAMLKVDLPQPLPAPEIAGLPPSANPVFLVGYFRNFGIRTKTDIRFKLGDLVDDGLINWPESDVKEMDPKSLDRRIRKHIQVPDRMGIWYASNKVFIRGERGASPDK